MSSRIIVKNIPKHMTPERFRSHFGQRGEVTDAKIMQTRGGKMRLFGFIGYKTPQQAKEAAQYFDKTFLDTSKIVVEVAKPVGDPNLGRPWSSHSQGSSAYLRKLKDKEQKEGIDPKKRKREDGVVGVETFGDKKDIKLNEFLDVMKPKSATKLWANDDQLAATITQEMNTKQNPKKQKVEAKVATVENKRRGGKGIMLKKIHVKFENSDEEASDDEYEDLNEVQKGDDMETEVNEEDKALVNDPTISDLDYLKSRMSKSIEDLDKEENIEDLDDDVKVEPKKQKKNDKKDDKKKNDKTDKKDAEKKDEKSTTEATGNEDKKTRVVEEAEDLGKTGRLFIRNLSYFTTEDELIEKFKKYGSIKEIHIPINKETKQSQGYAFIQYMNPADALKAMNEADGHIFQGRLLHIIPSKTLQVKREINNKNGKNFKTAKSDEKKEGATTEQHAWNSLFMGSDAVADSIANRLGVQKSDVLDRESSNMAVRLALAETQIINETKKFLEQEGVSLDILGKTKMADIKRSTTTILVKNIPFTTEDNQLRKLFEKFGGIARLVMPPARTIALVEMLEPTEAKAAFRGLAYRQLNGLPIYLEWAPVEIFIAKKVQQEEEKVEEKDEKVPGKSDMLEDEEEQTTTLYVKNLNFETTEEKLEEFFGSIGTKKVTIAKKTDPKNPGKMLSRGYGFVEFRTRDDAVKALKDLQGKKLDDHSLDMKFSGRTTSNDKSSQRKGIKLQPQSNKLIIRNLPFEASKQELRELFRPFGQVKRVTIPRKMGNGANTAGTSRGFGFIEYMSKQDAQRAMESLQNTHLYGRHLVLEYAKDEKPKTTTDDILEMFE